MNLWMARADKPESVEHIFAIDEDDTESREKLARFRHVLVPAGGYSVRAWNAAAKHSQGAVLVQMADDFECPAGWDSAIRRELGSKVGAPKVLRVSDGLRNDALITLAIVTRPWFEHHGLFDPQFRNVYSDNDLTKRAEDAEAVIEARHLAFPHNHPMAGKAEWDATYTRGNDLEEYKRAKAIYEGKHGKE
jgi:hypothetical protein